MPRVRNFQEKIVKAGGDQSLQSYILEANIEIIGIQGTFVFSWYKQPIMSSISMELPKDCCTKMFNTLYNQAHDDHAYLLAELIVLMTFQN